LTDETNVIDGKWFIAECKPTRERTLRSSLERAGYDVYVASQTETKVYASRNRRKIETIVIPGKIFIHTTEADLWNILLANPGIYRFMINKASSDREKGMRVYAYVSDFEMQQLQYVLSNAPNPVMFTTKELSLGQQIEVMRGPLIGLKGELARIESATYIVLKMEMGERNYVFTEIPVQDVRPINESSRT
jgi:transcription antitermination factor NusG